MIKRLASRLKAKLLKSFAPRTVLPNVTLAALLVVATPGVAVAQASALQQRIEQRKQQLKTVVDPKEQKRLQTKCIAVQADLRILQQDLSGIITNYGQRYESIDAKVSLAVGKLQLGQKDVQELQKQQAVFVTKTAALDKVFADYKQTIEDIVAMDCAADVAGFMASLESARALHANIRTQTGEVKIQVDNILKILASHRTALQPAKSGGR